MARLSMQNNIKGAIGNLIFYESQGQMLVRTKPSRVKNPQTPAQQQHRMRFAAASRFLKPFRDVVNETFTTFAGKKNGYSAAMSYNMAFAMKGAYPDVAIDHNLTMISYGNAVLPKGLSLGKNGDFFELKWETATAEGAHAHDRVILVLCGNNWHRALQLDGAERKAGSCMFKIPHGYVSADCWVYVKAADVNRGRHLSMSWYGGAIEI